MLRRAKQMTRPYRKGNEWYVKLNNDYEIKFVSYEEAWEYYKENDTWLVNPVYLLYQQNEKG